MRPGLKTGLRLPSLKKPSLIGQSKQILLDECTSPFLPVSVLSVGRWNHDSERLVRYGENGQQSEYRLLLGTSKRGYRIRVSYEIKKEKKPLKFSLFSSPNNNFQSLTLKHYWQHQTNGDLIWYKFDNTIIQSFGTDNNSINNRFLTELLILVDNSSSLLINTLSILKTYPSSINQIVSSYPDMSSNDTDYLYFSFSTEDAGHLFNNILVEVL